MNKKDSKEPNGQDPNQKAPEASEIKKPGQGTIGPKQGQAESIEELLAQEKAKAEEYFDRYLRLQADFDNAKKRMQRDQQEFVKYANEQIIVELLSILDDLERSVEARETNHIDPTAFLQGIEMILSHIYELLKKNNVKAIEAKGKMFDPHQHEALMQLETAEHDEGTVLEELQKGYILGDKVIRTAKVQVAKKAETREQKPKET